MNVSSPQRVGFAVSFLCLAVPLAAPLAAQATHSLLEIPEQTASDLATRLTPVRRTMDRVGPSVVHVMVKVNDAFRLQRDSSGVVISPGGLVLTNWHLVKEMTAAKRDGATLSVKIKTDQGVEYPAKIVAHDAGTDLALIQTEIADGAKLPFARLGTDPIPGEIALVGSRPGQDVGKDIYANFIGSISPSLSGVLVNGATMSKDDIVLADANVKVFADGSPVFDINGRVIGIVNSSNVRPPLHEKSSDEERRAYRTSFGFATRTKTACRVFAKQLAELKSAESAEELQVRRAGLAAAVESAKPAIVSVRRAAMRELPEPEPGDPFGKFPNDQIGSGVVVHESGLVLTNYHVASSGDVLVTTLDGKTYPGKVVDKAEQKNVALVKLELPEGTKLPFLKLANSDEGILGERVASLGNRYGTTVTVKVGVLSSKQRAKDVGDQHARSMGHFQTDATIHNGNTGGALVNLDGELLGVNDVRAAIDEMDEKDRHNALMALTDTTIGFAVPANWIREQLRKGLVEFAGESSPLVVAAKSSPESVARRESPVTQIVQKYSDCFLNVFVKRVTMGAPKGGLMEELFPEPADDKNFRLLGQGSGVIIDPTGLALTNWHVVNAATYPDGAPRKDHKVFVSLSTGEKYEVEILSTSRIDDLALLQLKLSRGQKLSAIRLGDSDAIKVGDTAIAVGNPHGFANSVTVGLVSAKDRDIKIKDRARYFRGLIQTDAAINPGNSGGALIDLNGYLIGINNAGHMREAKQGFSIPVNYVRQKFHSTLLSSDKLRSVFLGMETESRDGHTVIKAVSEFGPAADAGLKAGDRITKAQGEPVVDSVQFVKIARRAQPFRPFALEISRGKEAKEVTLDPVSDASWAIFRRANFAVKEVDWGQAGKQLKSAAIAAYREYTGDKEGAPTEFLDSGLVVTHVLPRAVAEGMDMKKGDVIVGMLQEVREIHLQQPRYVLENFDSIKSMRDFMRSHATEEGTTVEIWTVRDGKVLKPKVVVKKPPIK